MRSTDGNHIVNGMAIFILKRARLPANRLWSRHGGPCAKAGVVEAVLTAKGLAQHGRRPSQQVNSNARKPFLDLPALRFGFLDVLKPLFDLFRYLFVLAI